MKDENHLYYFCQNYWKNFPIIQYIEILSLLKTLNFLITYIGGISMELTKLIAKRTQQLLKERKWKQYKLARLGAIPCSTLSYILNGKVKSISTETLLNICRGFNIELNEFFNNEMFAFENISDN